MKYNPKITYCNNKPTKICNETNCKYHYEENLNINKRIGLCQIYKPHLHSQNNPEPVKPEDLKKEPQQPYINLDDKVKERMNQNISEITDMINNL